MFVFKICYTIRNGIYNFRNIKKELIGVVLNIMHKKMSVLKRKKRIILCKVVMQSGYAHILRRENAEKWTYTQSYPHYPQEKMFS